MAYKPISQTKTGGYKPIGTAVTTPKPVLPPIPDTAFPIGNTSNSTKAVGDATTVGFQTQLPKIAKEVFQSTTRGAAATGSYVANRAILGADKESALKQEFAPQGGFQKAIFGQKPFSVQTEAVDPLKAFGVSNEKAKQFGPTALIGLTAADLFTGPGKKSAFINASKLADNVTDAQALLRAQKVPDEVIFGLKLDQKIVAAKTDAQVTKVLDEIEQSVKAPVAAPRIDNVDTPAIAPKVVDEVPTTPVTTAPRVIPQVAEAIAKSSSEDEILNIVKNSIPELSKSPELPALLRVLRNKTVPEEIVDIIDPVLKRLPDERPRKFTEKKLPVPAEGQSVVYFTKTDGDEQFVSTDYNEALKFAPDPQAVEIGLVPTTALKMSVDETQAAAGIATIPRTLADQVINENRLPVLPKLRKGTGTNEDIIATARNRYGEAARRPATEDTRLATAATKPETTGGLKMLTGQLLTPISSRLGRINPELTNRLRQFEFIVNQKTYRQNQEILPLLNAVKKMSEEDQAVFDLARKNGDSQVIDALATKYDIDDELNKVRDVLDDLYTRAKDVGLEVEYRKDYFPRVIKNPTAYLQYLRGREDWSELTRRIQKAAEDKGIKYTDLTEEEMAGIANSFIRGYGDKLSLPGSGFTKQRTIEVIDDKLNAFYESSDSALITYITRMNDEIEGRKFFGKESKIDPTKANINDSIGAYVIDLVVKGKIKPQQEKEVADIFKSRFNRGKMNGALDAYRNFEYISTMGSPISAITQIADLSFSVFENGFYETAKAAGRSIVGKSKITKEQIGIENIVQEFSKNTFAGKAVDKVFTAVGLTKMDRLGKESLINSTFSRAVKRAKSNDPELIREFKFMYGDEAAQVMDDFKNNRITDNTKFYAFNTLLDFQPVAKSEMPQKYLEMPNGRIFYTLKSFTIKQIDVFRRKAIDDIVSGDTKRAVRGVRKLIYLSGLFMAGNATADEIKDFILDRETPMSDRLADNIYRLFGATKYDIYKAREEGFFRTVQSKILFPTSIFDRFTKDVSNVIQGKEYETGPRAGEAYKLESTQTIPVVGKFYYWWMGRGDQKQEYAKDGVKKPESTMPQLPTLPTLPKLPKLPTI